MKSDSKKQINNDEATKKLLAEIELFLTNEKSAHPIESIKKMIQDAQISYFSEERLTEVAEFIYKNHFDDFRSPTCFTRRGGRHLKN